MKPTILVLAICVAFSACAREELDQEQSAVSADKFAVCHNGHSIDISSNAWPAHQAHGDTKGACGSRVLSIALAGAGTGEVSDAALGTLCPGACTHTFDSDTEVTLSAVANAGSVFAGWGGACTGTGTCVLEMTEAAAITATFLPTPTHVLTTTVVGTGTGDVFAGALGQLCNGCATSFVDGTAVVLSASARPGSVFVGWSGACSGIGSCFITMSSDLAVTATFAPSALPTYTLTTAIGGTGAGAIFGGPALGQMCPGACSNELPVGGSVTLSAFAAPNTTFVGWTGACSGSSNVCVLTMDAAKTVTAVFGTATTHVLTTTVTGTGFGNITAGSLGALCNGCATAFVEGTTLTLSANPFPGSVFVGWSGACAGTGACVVTMASDLAVSATFEQGQPTTVLTTAVTGTGEIFGGPALGQLCPGPCSNTLPIGSTATLQAFADPGATFVGWTGACSGSSNVCVVSLDGAKTVTAIFTGAQTRNLTTTIDGLGTAYGSIFTGPMLGSLCDGCVTAYPVGQTVMLTASPFPGSIFIGWSGACMGLGPCAVTMSSDQTVTATFVSSPTGNPTLTTAIGGTGSGAIFGGPLLGQVCPGACSTSLLPIGSQVVLTASADAGSVFVGWSGACSGSGSLCSVMLDAPKSVTAIFAAAP